MPTIAPNDDRPIDPRAFSIKSGKLAAFARDITGKAVDLEARRAEMISQTRSALLDDGDEMYLEGTASSSIEDRMGDTLDANAQAGMLEQAKGLTMFLDHVYTLPESLLGKCVEATLAMRTDPKVGDVLDLDIVVQIEKENPRAVKCWSSIQRGIKLGLSIGGQFTDVDFKGDDDDWCCSGLIVHEVNLLEISLVGIPANPRAYTKFIAEMVKHFKANAVAAAEQIAKDAARWSAASTRKYITKSLLGGLRPEDITVQTRAAGTREDANDDPNGMTVPENPNATPTRDRPVMPENSPTPASPSVGPPNADEPLAVPQVGSEKVTGANQPAEANPVSPNNAAPAPARPSADQPSPEGYQPVDTPQLPSRPEQHDAQGVAGAVKPDATATTTQSAPATGSAPSNTTSTTNAPGKPTMEDVVATGDEKAFRFTAKATTEADSDTASPLLGADQVPARRAVLKSMRAMRRLSMHGVCTASMGHLMAAHKSAASLIGDDIPNNAQLYTGDDDDDVQRSAAVTHTASVTDLDAKRIELTTELTTLETTLAQKRGEAKTLDDQITALRATPMGRRSLATNPTGSTQSGSEPSVPATAYRSNGALSADPAAYERSA